MWLRDELIVPVIVLRNNITIPGHKNKLLEQLSKKTEEIVNGFGKTRVYYKFPDNFTAPKVIIPADTKTFIVAINCLYDTIQAPQSEQERNQVIEQAYTKGLPIEIVKILKYRNLSDASKNRTKIKESLEKYCYVGLQGEFWVTLSEKIGGINKRTITQKGGLSYLTSFSCPEKESFAPGKRQCVQLQFNYHLVRNLMQSRSYVKVDRDIFNRLEGLAFNLYLYLIGQDLRKHAVKSYSFKVLARESHFFFSPCACNHPGAVKQKILKAFERLKRSGAIQDYKEKLLTGGVRGIEIVFCQKNKEGSKSKNKEKNSTVSSQEQTLSSQWQTVGFQWQTLGFSLNDKFMS